MSTTAAETEPPQRIVKIRRDYNTWVANETIEDYALRYTPRSFRKWSVFRVSNTAFGAISFLVLEAIGGTITVNYGFINALWAIMAYALELYFGLPLYLGYMVSALAVIPLVTHGVTLISRIQMLTQPV